MSANDPTLQDPDQPRFEPGRRELFGLLAFVVTVIAAGRLLAGSDVRHLVPPQLMANQLQLYAEAVREEPVDVLVVGSSRVQAAIDPSVIEGVLRAPEGGRADDELECARVFVQGIRAWGLWKLVDELLLESPPSELLVLGLEARYFYALPFEATEQVGLRLVGDELDLLESESRLLTLDQQAQLALRAFRGVQAPWNLPLLLDPELEAYVEHLHETGGLPERDFRPLSQRELLLARAVGEEIAERRGGPMPTELRPLEVASFERLLDALEQLPCDVVFVRLPIEPPFQAEQAQGFAAYEREIVAPLVEAGHTYVDLNRFAHLTRPDGFENPTHVNEQGRAQTSRTLAFECIAPRLLGPPPESLDLDAVYAAAAAAPLWSGEQANPPVPGYLQAHVDQLLEERLSEATPDERRQAIDRELLELRQRTVERLQTAYDSGGWPAFIAARDELAKNP